MTNATTLETRTCGRCGGSGSYSWCQMHGSTCFGCGGTGKVYTKRGHAAAAFLRALREVPADSIVVGDIVFVENLFGNGGKFETVLEVKKGRAIDVGAYAVGHEDAPSVVIITKSCANHCNPTDAVRKGYTGAEKAEQFAKALAYQATLGVNGQPLKRAKAAA